MSRLLFFFASLRLCVTLLLRYNPRITPASLGAVAMRLLAAVVCLAAFPKFAAADPNPIAWTEALTPDQEKKAFKLHPGFEAQLVASEPDILKPIQMAFDAKGRL